MVNHPLAVKAYRNNRRVYLLLSESLSDLEKRLKWCADNAHISESLKRATIPVYPYRSKSIPRFID